PAYSGCGGNFRIQEKKAGYARRNLLQLEVTLDEFTEFFAVFVAHMHKFNAAAVWANVADHGGEIDLAETGANLELDGVADAELPGGLQIGAAQTDCFYTRQAC